MNIPESIRNEPHKWRQTSHSLDHDDGLSVWTVNGFFFINTYPNSNISLIMKIKIWLAWRWWSDNQPVSRKS